MREILFRGQTPYSKEWNFGTGLLHSSMHVWIVDNPSRQAVAFGEKRYQVIPETIGQFTGAYDVNANKIFEHDIVRKIVDGNELIGVVEYSDGAFGVRFADGSGQFLCFFDRCCEVIGNVHDNPELINKGE